jgi:RimJ/RimL family protein N-acetyltransferase
MTVQAESDIFVDPDRVVIRPLTAADGEAYRRLRQHILDSGDGKFFSSSYTREQQFTSEDHWRKWCTETPVRCTIGVFVDAELVGVSGIVPSGDPENLITEWQATWLDPKYRKSGVARQAYEKRHQWSYDHGYRYAVGDVHADNVRALEIWKRQGNALYLFTQRDVTWADGSTADTHFFMGSLSPGAEGPRSVDQAVGLLEAALTFLKREQRNHAHGACP